MWGMFLSKSCTKVYGLKGQKLWQEVIISNYFTFLFEGAVRTPRDTKFIFKRRRRTTLE